MSDDSETGVDDDTASSVVTGAGAAGAGAGAKAPEFSDEGPALAATVGWPGLRDLVRAGWDRLETGDRVRYRAA